MNGKTLSRTNRLLLHEREQTILDVIVDAMLDAKGQLQQAGPDQWARILTQSCRRRKRSRRSLGGGSLVAA